jgi:hypothetical protein
MAKLLLLLALIGCGDSRYDGCANPCPGADVADFVYFCDGGPCPVGESTAQPYFQCRCTNGSILTFAQPDAASCPAARANWTAFYDAHCR